jgi:hypothetical protein
MFLAPQPQRAPAQQVTCLLQRVRSDPADAGIPQLATDRRCAAAHNVGLWWATIALHAAGYRASGAGFSTAATRAPRAPVG